MAHIKGYYDGDLLEYFLDLDEEFDIFVSCDNLTIIINIDESAFRRKSKLENLFLQILNRISRLESIGEFESNPIWRTLMFPSDHSKIYFNVPREVLRGFMGGEKYITIGDDEFRDIGKFVEKADRWIRESLLKRQMLKDIIKSININVGDISVYKIEIDFKKAF